ncbi:MAG: type II restriction endonuclease [Candidatus Omnitrophica bacterium]|nr:type II restriction endonuclease [Candidatus Omnitrophota bacterium]
MVKFIELGFESFKDFINEFFNTLLLSNKTYEYFVDWEKVKSNINKHLDELFLLNSLTKVAEEKRKEYLFKLLFKYPQIVEVIPLLIAERVKNSKIDIFVPELEELVIFEFRKNKVTKKSIPMIIDFCIKTGVIELFSIIKDLHDYLLGVEVGLDSNARKNRSGEIFEKMCKNKINKLIGNNFLLVSNDPNFSLYSTIEKEKRKAKTHDIVVYRKGTPVLIIECNFYNVTGSKPISIAESYIEMQRAAKKNKIEFLWITDGPAWLKMKEPLLRSMREIDWILNFKMINCIEKILK